MTTTVMPAAALRATTGLRAHDRHRSTREPRRAIGKDLDHTHTPTDHLQAQMQQQAAARQ
jgi:hypothetical protein